MIANTQAVVAWARLEVRRTLFGAPMVLYGLWFALLLATDFSPAIGSKLNPEAERSARGIAREALLGGALLWWVPLLLLRAGSIIQRWRRGEADWLGSRPTSRTQVLFGTWIGLALAGSIALTLSGWAVAYRVGPGETSWRFLGSQSLAGPRRLEPGEELTLGLALPTGPAAEQPMRARVYLTRTFGGGSGGDNLARGAELQLELIRGDQIERATVRLHGRSRITIPVPDPPSNAAPTSAQRLRLRLANSSASSVALLPERTLELWSRAAREGRACFEWVTRSALALAAAAALALGLGAWVGAATAAGSTLALWLIATRAGPARIWLPGSRLLRDLEFVRDGLLPEPFEPRWILGTLACVALGIAVGVLGLRSWRFPR